MKCKTRHIHDTNCLDRLDECCRLQTRDNVLLYFMGDFGRARLWTGVMKLAYLAPRLRELNTAVVLVGEVADGNEERMRAAARLAEELNLPFPLVADCQRSLWRRYAAAAADPTGGRAGVILVDRHGQSVSGWPLQGRQQSLDLQAVVDALEALQAE